VVLDDLFDFLFHLGGNSARGDLLEQSILRRGQVSAEFFFPLGDLVNWDGIELQCK
jgi:hypothetical protein